MPVVEGALVKSREFEVVVKTLPYPDEPDRSIGYVSPYTNLNLTEKLIPELIANSGKKHFTSYPLFAF